MTRPGLRDLILLEAALEVRLSPRGDRAAVRVEHPRWDDNRYCRDVVIVDVASGEQRRLTRYADCQQIRWLDDDVLAVLKSDGSTEGMQQVHVYEGLVGDGWQVTDAEHGVDAFEPFADGIVYLARKDDDPRLEAREERFGTFQHVETDPGRTAAYYLDLARLADHERSLARADKDERELLVRPVIELSALIGEPLAIQSVVTSPAGDSVYVNARPTDELTTSIRASVHRITVDADTAVAEFVRRETARKQRDHDAGIAEESDERRDQRDLSYLGTAQRLALPTRAAVEAVSPDGTGLVVRFPGRDTRVSTNAELWVAPRNALTEAATPDEARRVLREVTAGVDQTCFSPVWHDHGIDVVHAEGTRWAIQRLDPEGTAAPRRIDTGEVWCHASFHGSFHTTPSGRVSFVGGSATAYPEAWTVTEEGARRLTRLGDQVADWDLGEVRTIRWTSKDGTEVEGTLRLPPGFDPAKKHPLAFVVHGGPTWIDTEELLPMTARRYYPEAQLAAQGVIVLHPNYRGSLGRGLDFQELNVGNLGVGDLWDVESAIDHLDGLGWVDTDRVGCMGWSQGGYISAFAGLHSDRFAAVSVGAGISDWYTYAISNDIPDFTRDFLGVDLFGDRSALVASAPISGLDGANTPMLIQHGAKDQRVPLSNAMELYRGLQERDVPVELFVYPDFAHPVTRPREHHAVLHQNLAWFRHYLLGEELDLVPGLTPDGPEPAATR